MTYKCVLSKFEIKKLENTKKKKKKSDNSKKGKKNSKNSNSKKKSKKSNNKKVDNIIRFKIAYDEGIRPIDNLDRPGVKYEVALAEIENSAIKKKTSDYIWYIFPQPYSEPESGQELSETEKYFHITDGETKLFLNDKLLASKLDKILSSLEAKSLSPEQLKEYFSSNGDDKKFKSFRNHFKKIIREMKPEDGTLISQIRDKLSNLQID